jgi:hypothetical protein
MDANTFIEKLDRKSREYTSLGDFKVVNSKGEPIEQIIFDDKNNTIIIDSLTQSEEDKFNNNIFILERIISDGNEILMISEDKSKIKSSLENDIETYKKKQEIPCYLLPYYLLSIWRNGECQIKHWGREAKKYLGINT